MEIILKEEIIIWAEKVVRRLKYHNIRIKVMSPYFYFLNISELCFDSLKLTYHKIM